MAVFDLFRFFNVLMFRFLKSWKSVIVSAVDQSMFCNLVKHEVQWWCTVSDCKEKPESSCQLINSVGVLRKLSNLNRNFFFRNPNIQAALWFLNPIAPACEGVVFLRDHRVAAAVTCWHLFKCSLQCSLTTSHEHITHSTPHPLLLSFKLFRAFSYLLLTTALCAVPCRDSEFRWTLSARPAGISAPFFCSQAFVPWPRIPVQSYSEHGLRPACFALIGCQWPRKPL